MRHTFEFGLLASLLMFAAPHTIAFAQDRPAPSGSLLTRFCEAEPNDAFCRRIAEARQPPASGNQPIPNASPAIGQADIGGEVSTYIVTTNGVIRSEPSTARGRATIIGSVTPGQRITAISRFENEGREWLQITTPTNTPAYIASSLTRPE